MPTPNKGFADMQISTRQLVLQRLLNVVQSRVTNQVLADAKWETYVEYETDSMMFRLRKYVLSERLQGDVEVPVFVPIKVRERRGLLRWLWGMDAKVREYTVYRRVTIPVASYNTFPEAQIRYPEDLGQPVRVQMWEGDYR